MAEAAEVLRQPARQHQVAEAVGAGYCISLVLHQVRLTQSLLGPPGRRERRERPEQRGMAAILLLQLARPLIPPMAARARPVDRQTRTVEPAGQQQILR